jgi:hypothetical protein
VIALVAIVQGIPSLAISSEVEVDFISFLPFVIFESWERVREHALFSRGCDKDALVVLHGIKLGDRLRINCVECGMWDLEGQADAAEDLFVCLEWRDDELVHCPLGGRTVKLY